MSPSFEAFLATLPDEFQALFNEITLDDFPKVILLIRKQSEDYDSVKTELDAASVKACALAAQAAVSGNSNLQVIGDAIQSIIFNLEVTAKVATEKSFKGTYPLLLAILQDFSDYFMNKDALSLANAVDKTNEFSLVCVRIGNPLYEIGSCAFQAICAALTSIANLHTF